MNYPDFVDKEMCDLLDTMGKAIVPRSKRNARVKTNWHTPCYSHSRYRVL